MQHDEARRRGPGSQRGRRKGKPPEPGKLRGHFRQQGRGRRDGGRERAESEGRDFVGSFFFNF